MSNHKEHEHHHHHHHHHHHEQHYEWKLIVDNEPYYWHEESITGEQIRKLASVPDGVQVWEKHKGSPGTLVERDTVIHLNKHETKHFYLQEASSGAG